MRHIIKLTTGTHGYAPYCFSPVSSNLTESSEFHELLMSCWVKISTYVEDTGQSRVIWIQTEDEEWTKVTRFKGYSWYLSFVQENIPENMGEKQILSHRFNSLFFSALIDYQLFSFFAGTTWFKDTAAATEMCSIDFL